MNTGMLWFDNDPRRSLDDKVSRAAEHYLRRYGQSANVVFVHPAEGLPEMAGGLSLRTSSTVLPNHFWVGVAE